MPQRQFQGEQKTTFAQRLVNWGLAEDTKTANIILISIAVGAIIIAVGVWVFVGGSDGGEDLRKEYPPGSSVI